MPLLLPILNWLGSLIGGPIIKAGVDAYKAKLDAGNTSERIAADVASRELEVERRERELQAQIVLAEQGNWFTRSVRPLWALPFVAWTWKVVVYDNMLGRGVTDPLGGQAEQLCLLIAGAYFIGRSAEKVASIVKRK